MKTELVILLLYLIVGIAFIICFISQAPIKENKYQGPVPEGYNEEYFRNTGITQKLIE